MNVGVSRLEKLVQRAQRGDWGLGMMTRRGQPISGAHSQPADFSIIRFDSPEAASGHLIQREAASDRGEHPMHYPNRRRPTSVFSMLALACAIVLSGGMAAAQTHSGWLRHSVAAYSSTPLSPPMQDAFRPVPKPVGVDSTALGYPFGVAPPIGRAIMYRGLRYQVVRLVPRGGGQLVASGNGSLVNDNGAGVIVVLVARNPGPIIVHLH
jgi:hypothetical protein